MNQQNATIVIIFLLLAIVIRAALESTFGQISEQGWASISIIQWCQVVVFFILTLRFYLGAFRYGSIEPKKLNFHIKALNFVFAFLLFSSFYSVGYFVISTKYFYALVIALHVIDATWFLVVLICSVSITDEVLDVGEVKITAYRRIMGFFLALSAVTIAYGFLSYPFIFDQSIFSEEEIAAHYWFLGVLVILTLFDFVVLDKYYFRHDEWIGDNAKP